MDATEPHNFEPREYIKKIQTYKPGRPIEEVIRELGLKSPIIKLASNENPIGTSPLALKAMRAAMKETYLYPDDNCYYLKHELAGRLEVKQENLFIGNGSVEILPLLALAFLSPGEAAIASKGAFIWYKIAVNIANGELTEVPMRHLGHDLPAIIGAIKRDTRIIFIDNPINPTGTMSRADEMEEFLRKVPENILLVIDEAYKEYISDPDYPDHMRYFRLHPNILLLRTFSKIYGLAGARLGYAVAHPDVVGAIMKLRISFNVNRISQAAGVAALDDFEHVRKARELNEEGKVFLYDAYKRLGVSFVPSHANFVFVLFERDSQIIFEALQSKGIITRTVKEYGFHNALRITIGNSSQNRRLVRTLREIL